MSHPILLSISISHDTYNGNGEDRFKIDKMMTTEPVASADARTLRR